MERQQTRRPGAPQQQRPGSPRQQRPPQRASRPPYEPQFQYQVPMSPVPDTKKRNPLLFPLVISSVLAIVFFALWISKPAESNPAMKNDTPDKKVVANDVVDETAQSTVKQKTGENPAPKAVSKGEQKFSLNEPIELDSSTITFKTISVATDLKGNPILKFTYDWTNNGDKSTSASWAYSLKGFQNGVETESTVFSDFIDYGIGQKEVMPGGTITDAEDGIEIVDINSPITIIVQKAFSFSNDKWVLEIEDLTQYQ